MSSGQDQSISCIGYLRTLPYLYLGSCGGPVAKLSIAFANPPATLGAVAQLANQVQQEQQGAIADAWQTRAKTTVKTFVIVFINNILLDLFPINTKRRIG